MKEPQSEQLVFWLRLKPTPPEYKSEVLTLELTCSMPTTMNLEHLNLEKKVAAITRLDSSLCNGQVLSR
jgi:hypothetical protein